MKIFHLLAQTLWLGFLVYFLIQRTAIQQALGDKYWLAAILIFIITLALFLKRPKN